MEIKNNRLVGADFKLSPNTSGLVKDFRFIILHDDEGYWEGTTSWLLNPESKVSYHIYISKSGEVRQFVDLNKRAYHAGKSSWKGYTDLNYYSVGVCFQNINKETYTEAQISKGVEVCKALIQAKGYKEIVRHKDVAPTRKTDTNQNFPFEEFKRRVYDSDLTVKIKTKYTTANVNLRPSAGVNNTPIQVLGLGTEVHVLSEQGTWTEVSVCSSNKRGWVSSQYLK